MKLTKKQMEAHKAAKLRWKMSQPEAYKASYTKRNAVWRYKGFLTETEILSLLKKRQNDRCQICRRKSAKALHIDHDHKKVVFRGLICASCNHMLGFAKDDIRILTNAIEYLKRS